MTSIVGQLRASLQGESAGTPKPVIVALTPADGAISLELALLKVPEGDMVKSLLFSLVMLTPRSKLKNCMLRLLGHHVHPDARIGPVLAIRLGLLEMDRASSIGPGNVIRDVERLKLGEGAGIRQWNWIGAASPLVERGAPGELVVGKCSSITSRHYLDCSGGIYIDQYVTVAGVRSTFITHGIDVSRSVQSYRSIRIGDYALVSSNCKLVPGATVPARSLVGMGAVVAEGLRTPQELLVGVPARPLRATGGKYFERSEQSVNLPD